MKKTKMENYFSEKRHVEELQKLNHAQRMLSDFVETLYQSTNKTATFQDFWEVFKSKNKTKTLDLVLGRLVTGSPQGMVNISSEEKGKLYLPLMQAMMVMMAPKNYLKAEFFDISEGKVTITETGRDLARKNATLTLDKEHQRRIEWLQQYCDLMNRRVVGLKGRTGFPLFTAMEDGKFRVDLDQMF